MSDDLKKISPPSQLPPDQPDSRTSEEEKDLRSLTPTEYNRVLHGETVTTLNNRVAYHVGENDELKRERDHLRDDLKQEQETSRGLAVRCASMQGAGCFIEAMNIAGNLLTVAGGCMLSYAGAAPDLAGAEKSLYSGAGLAM